MIKQFYTNTSELILVARLVRWIATDHPGFVRDNIHILPCLCFFVNHSELYIKFAWLNIDLHAFYKNWKRHDKYIQKQLKKMHDEHQ